MIGNMVGHVTRDLVNTRCSITTDKQKYTSDTFQLSQIVKKTITEKLN